MVDVPLRPNQEILQAALDCMGEGMFIVGLDGTIAFFSARAEELTGIRASDIVGKECSAALRGGVCGIDHALLRGTSSDHEDFEFVLPDGVRLRAHRTLRPITGGGGSHLGTVVTFHVLGGAAASACASACESRRADADGQESLHQFVGRSPAVRKVVDTVRRVAASEATVLITGESGTGKELVARAIHENSRRRSRPLIAVNCAAIPHDLLESELFGHVRGAFTGAVRDRKGSVELAAGGTLFLDEIGDLAMPMQAKLLRVLQERTYQRVGESRTQPTDVRILAATNADLEEAIAAGAFRQDLYFRLAVIPIRIPALRERREDIAPLATFLLSRRSVAAGRLPMRFSPEAMRLLENARWEGNVRQLINVVDYVVALCESATVDARNLPEEFVNARRESLPGRRGRYQACEHGDSEEALIRSTLTAQGYHRQRTAAALGMDRATLYRKMRDYRIHIPGDDQDETG
jgi:two-component system, NtrC family, response regulator HydG